MIPCLRSDSTGSPVMSRWQGVLLILKSVVFVSNVQIPLWRLVVKTTYFIPASLAMRAHSSGWNHSSRSALLAACAVAPTRVQPTGEPS